MFALPRHRNESVQSKVGQLARDIINISSLLIQNVERRIQTYWVTFLLLSSGSVLLALIASFTLFVSSYVVLSHSSESVVQLMLNSMQCGGISSSLAPFSTFGFILIRALVAGSVSVFSWPLLLVGLLKVP